MTKHLFLEGPVRSGKSTVIKSALADWAEERGVALRDILGGFSCKRYLDSNGDICCFGLVPPYDLEVDGLFDPEKQGDPDKEIAGEDPRIFLRRSSQGRRINNDVFINEGAAMMDSPSAKLIMLDEIGGVELMSDVFRDRLYRILGGDIPVIGVLKQMKHARTLESETKEVKDISSVNETLRRDITGAFNGRIVSFEREKAPEIRDIILSFLNEHLG